MEYIKIIHITCALLTGILFVGRGMLMIAGSPLLASRFFKVAPHVIDTVLLVSAVSLATMGSWNPLHHAWLLGKIVALFIYIGFGMMAFRFARTKSAKTGWWFLALLMLLQIYVFALMKSLWFYELLI